MNELIKKMKKIGSLSDSNVLSKSTLFNEKDSIVTDIPIINIGLSGTLDKGLGSGLTFVAGPSKHYKSLLGLLLVKAYLNKYPEGVCLFYDSEFGITPNYISSNGIDTDRILHIPIVNIEELKFDLSQKLDGIERGEKVIIFIDSIGNLASKKEADDALTENAAADMTRARQLKSLFRIVTPHFTKKDIPGVVVNHVYSGMGLYSPDVMGGGQGPMLSATQVFFIGKSQEKEGTDIIGYNFTMNVEKSRFVREKSKFKFTVTYEHGIQKYSGLMDIALEAGVVIKPSKGYYQKVNLETGEPEGNKLRLSETNNKNFWNPILESSQFNEFIHKRYQVGYNSLIQNEENEENEQKTSIT
jgi:RecA/RadA recombinase